MSLTRLPVELIHIIVKFLEEARYLNSLAQTCSRLHVLLNPVLYQNNNRSLHGFPLVWAAKHSSEATLKRAFDAGASTHSCGYNFRRSLVAAVDNSHETIVRTILEQNIDPGIFTQDQRCELCEDQRSEAASKVLHPLYLAAVRGDVTIVKLLLAHKVTFEHDHDCCGETCFDLAFAAVENGHLAVVKVLIEAGYALNDTQSVYWHKQPLHAAVLQGDTKMVEYLLDEGYEPSPQEEPPLMSAARNGDMNMVKLLLERGADPNMRFCGLMALSCAAGDGHAEIMEVLLDHGADPDPDMAQGWLSTLYYVAIHGQLQILDLLLARGVDIYPKEPTKKCILLSSIIGNTGWRSLERQKQAAFAAFFRTFVDFEDMINDKKDEAQAEVLYIAIGYGWDDIVKRVLENGFSADGIYRRCETRYERPILQAIDNGHIGITKLLVEHGANIQGYQGEIKALVERGASTQESPGEIMDEGALSLAIQLGNVQIAELLLDHGADINCTSSRGETVLAEAAMVSADMFRMLLDRGADPTKTPLSADGTFNPSSGETAITRALYFGAVEVVQILVDRGIALEMPPLPKQQQRPRNHQGPNFLKSPKKLIEEAFLGGEEMAELVLDRGLLKIDPESSEAQEGLVHAVQFGMTGVVKRLLERGVDPKLPSLYTQLSLLVAATYSPHNEGSSNATAILDLLLAHGADIEERCYPGMTPLYRIVMHVNAKKEWVADQAEVRLLLERGADPFAEHDHWGVIVTETSDAHAHSDSPFMSRRSIPNPNTGPDDDDDHPPSRMVKFVRQRGSLTGQGGHDDPFLACMRLGNKAVLKLMLDAIDRKGIPLEELKHRLDRARIEATENGNLQLLHIIEDYYWAKRYPCK
ncbi:hypothetical protein N7491_005049 [Penicillium cf. griseofulvum]|uniref:F-box domain-containing protein n=1 Tax=Penicillium cf. griseofulvum TaxID=2972120 RepID=A0A9W9J148_9EURO|nr:hypothetical protein N7472_007743 [Penicillium cf. griseofulvum]KAJ5434454.1 hypothetical protein N7491_005049 [Penicillium cf. griseofulvum]KAJ5452285.1 hypothetical protein N7445_000468 [Penicillium cf. griseofulvum]